MRSFNKVIAKLTGKRTSKLDGSSSIGEHHIQANGIVYTSILNSRDGRKNWGDIATAFVSCFQGTEDAILIFKLNEHDSADSLLNLEKDLRRFNWMKCRVIAFNGYLPDAEYQHFLDGIDYVVNASTGEGQCLPLMELMSMGTPAIAPDHTSMADYITEQNAFILPSTKYLTGWPHDPRFIYSTMAYQVPWDALRAAYERSYHVAKNDSPKYQAMSHAAHKHLEEHCSTRVAVDALNEVLQHVFTTRDQNP
jgi:glycosyltransferase involved in cell wall biosynthesis